MNNDKETYLVQLLNEYLDDGQERLYACYSEDEPFDKFFHTKDGEGTIEEAQVISKRFGFIERLCENKKIDTEKLKDESSMYFELSEHYKLENVLCMILSIQFRPLDFLSSILK